MPAIYLTYATLAVIAILFGAIGGGVWWTVTAVGFVGILAWFVIDRTLKRREPGSGRGPVQSERGA